MFPAATKRAPSEHVNIQFPCHTYLSHLAVVFPAATKRAPSEHVNDPISLPYLFISPRNCVPSSHQTSTKWRGHSSIASPRTHRSSSAGAPQRSLPRHGLLTHSHDSAGCHARAGCHHTGAGCKCLVPHQNVFPRRHLLARCCLLSPLFVNKVIFVSTALTILYDNCISRAVGPALYLHIGTLALQREYPGH